MAVLVAPGVCRFAVHGEYGGHEIVNIVDMRIDTTGAVESRESACNAQAGIIINEWNDSMLDLHHTSYSAMSVSWIDLNTDEGSVGVRAETDSTTWPAPGRAGGGGQPGNVATRVNKNTLATRGQRQGRMYLVGVSEGNTPTTIPNTIDPSVAAVFNPKLASFLGDINQDTDPANVDDYESEMVVVHTKNGLFTSASTVESLTIDLYTASQVRRIRR